MDGNRFDTLTRTVNAVPSRRGLLGGAAGSVIGIVAARFPGAVAVKRKRRGQKAKPNAYGCLDVGKACGGKNSTCCSGICQGKTPKKGKRDTSRCIAHDSGGCQAGQDSCGATVVSCITSTGVADGVCFTTTGKAGYCSSDSFCVPCRRDADCQEAYGPQAACVVCATCEHGTVCAQPDDLL